MENFGRKVYVGQKKGFGLIFPGRIFKGGPFGEEELETQEPKVNCGRFTSPFGISQNLGLERRLISGKFKELGFDWLERKGRI